MSVLYSIIVEKTAANIVMNPDYLRESARSVAQVLVKTETDIDKFREGVEASLKKSFGPYISVAIQEYESPKKPRSNEFVFNMIISLAPGFYSFKAH